MSQKRIINTDRLMTPIAHFSHAVRVGEMLYVGATAGTDAERRLAGSTPGAIDLAAQTTAMLDNMETVLGLLGCSPRELVRLKLYVNDERDMAHCEEACDKRYAAIELRSAIVGSAGFPLPQAAVELDAVALVGARPSTLHTPGAVVRGTKRRSYVVAHALEPASATVPVGAQAQSEAVVANLRAAIEAAGMTPGEVVNLHVTMADLRDLVVVDDVLSRVLCKPYPSCAVVQAPMWNSALKVQLEAVCLRGGGVPVTAPGCDGVLTCASPAILAGDELFISAQTGVTKGGEENDVQAQARRAFAKVDKLLAAAGIGVNNLLRTNNVLIDWRDYGAFNLGYGASVVVPYPPRTTVLGGLVVPGARVQIEGIAHCGPGEFVVVDRSARH